MDSFVKEIPMAATQSPTPKSTHSREGANATQAIEESRAPVSLLSATIIQETTSICMVVRRKEFLPILIVLREAPTEVLIREEDILSGKVES